MPLLTLPKKQLAPFLSQVMERWEVFGPVKRDILRFERLEDPSQLDFSENTYYPLKEQFFRKQEPLFQFDGIGFKQIRKARKKRVFFGVRRCDLNAIKHQDMVFAEDPAYQDEREGSVLVGYHCNTAPSKYCFCSSMELVDFYDLMFFERGGHFVVDVKTAKGKQFLRPFRHRFRSRSGEITDTDRAIKTRTLNTKIESLYEHKDWEKGIKRCLSCAACTEMCPTCYCHEVKDQVDLKNPHRGERVRQWSSCQLKEFTRVAGDHVFREDRGERFKHRIYHQIQYFREKHGVYLCTGCGRCISGCPTRIDWVGLANGMKQ